MKQSGYAPAVYRTALAVAMLAFGSVAQAQSFRCDAGIVATGDQKPAVLQKCGEPMLTDSFCKTPPASATTNSTTAQPSAVVPCETVEDWTYNPGSGRFMTTVRFEQGSVVSITRGERVK